MSKKIIHFSKLFVPFVILSLAIITFGLYGLFTRGLNMGLDFKAGLIQEVRIAPTALQLTYSGAAAVSVDVDAVSLSLIVSGVGADNTTFTFPYATYATVGELVAELNTVDNVTATAIAPLSTSVIDIFANSVVSAVLSSTPYRLYYTGERTPLISIEEVRTALLLMTEVSVKEVGESANNGFQIRISDDGTNPEVSKTIQDEIWLALTTKFGDDTVAILKTDFIGAQFSNQLAVQSIFLVLGTLVLIWIYATIRFKWDFALGAILAIIHDALIMLTFVVWTGLEFNATMIAAILTIIGYSINDTVVVLDRIRQNVRILKIKKFKDILDLSQTEILGRTIITTVTTLLAVFSLYFFTTGSMKEFALALIVGMLSGIYSTIFIASAFIAFTRRNWKPSDEEKKTQVIEVEV